MSVQVDPDATSAFLDHADADINEQIAAVAAGCPNLTHLSLYQTLEKQVPGSPGFNTSTTSRLSAKSIQTIAESFPLLARLSIRDYPELTDADVQALVENHPDLQEVCLWAPSLTDVSFAAIIHRHQITHMNFGVYNQMTPSTLDIARYAFPRKTIVGRGRDSANF